MNYKRNNRYPKTVFVDGSEINELKVVQDFMTIAKMRPVSESEAFRTALHLEYQKILDQTLARR